MHVDVHPDGTVTSAVTTMGKKMTNTPEVKGATRTMICTAGYDPAKVVRSVFA